MSSYVKRFEKRGHVVREPNPDDGRSYLIRLTGLSLAVLLEQDSAASATATVDYAISRLVGD